jgi:hypothetical protein
MSQLYGVRQTIDRVLARASLAKSVLRPLYYATQKLRYGRLMLANAELKNRYAARRLFVLCTGGGIDEIDFARLRGQAVVAVGLLAKHIRFHELETTFYADLEPIHNLSSRQVLSDILCPPDGIVIGPDKAERVIGDLFSAFDECNGRSMLRQAPYLFYKLISDRSCSPATRFFLNVRSRRFFADHHLFENRRISWIMKAAPPIALATRQSDDLAGAPTFVDGVVYFAVAAGIYMGFKEIVLVGAGYTYSPIQEFRFYDIPIASPAYSERDARVMLDRLARSRGCRLQTMERVAKGFRPVFVRDKTIDHRHRILQEFAENHGVKIYNLVPDGFDSPLYAPVTRTFVEREWLSAANVELSHAQ